MVSRVWEYVKFFQRSAGKEWKKFAQDSFTELYHDELVAFIAIPKWRDSWLPEYDTADSKLSELVMVKVTHYLHASSSSSASMFASSISFSPALYCSAVK